MKVRWATPAVNDLTCISDYIGKQGGNSAARRIALTIFDRANTLKQFPQRGRMGRIAGTRELLIIGLPYLIVYRICKEVVEINRVLHGAQKWP